MEETLRALDDLVRQGKVRYIGCSNHPAWQVVDAHVDLAAHLGLHSFVSCQDEYSLLVRGPEKELLPAMEAFGLGMLPYFPLASGMLTGKHKRGKLSQGTRLESRLASPIALPRTRTSRSSRSSADFCKKRGHTLLELAFSWLAANPVNSSIIAGATKPEQLEQNVKAVDWEAHAGGFVGDRRVDGSYRRA